MYHQFVISQENRMVDRLRVPVGEESGRKHYNGWLHGWYLGRGYLCSLAVAEILK